MIEEKTGKCLQAVIRHC